uniref:NADH-ubiquinone oxidoreductase chain 5 n=1 Tax=Rhynchocinetes durbanensis TaxID=516932 RepID=A0A109PMB9_9EUCA|nr:NADH dehydrogenase subunit 5 [Rhynchocinetes durbanensis]AMA20513.1 NADH dehydrogenase subunit 5 [Rhynchocinetes durbanensis]
MYSKGKVSVGLVSEVVLLFMACVVFFLGSIFVVNGLKVVIEWEVLTLNSCVVEMSFILDWMSLFFLSLVSFISSMVLKYSGGYMAGEKNKDRFFYLVLGFVSSMFLLIISPNLISILLGWDGLGLISYALVIFYQNEKSGNAGMLTALSNRIGDVAILVCIVLMVDLGGWNFVFVCKESMESYSSLWLLIVIAGMTKSAQIPFSAWLPAAMAAPTPVSALVHSSTLVTAGVYLLIRFNGLLEGTENMKYLLFFSSATMIMSGMAANFETDLKKIIALSTLSQLSVMMFTLSVGFPILSFFHLLTHALFKALLFMCAGSMIHNMSDYQDIRKMGNLSSFLPMSVGCMNLANLALCGMPFLAGFYSKDLILETSFSSSLEEVSFFLLIVATLLTVMYSVRLSYFSMVSYFNSSPESSVNDEMSEMTSPMIVLGVSAVFGGCLLSWMIFPSPEMICLSVEMKMLAFMLIFFGVILSIILNSWEQNLSGNKKSYGVNSAVVSYPFAEFSSSMWSLGFFFTFFVSSKSLPLSDLIYKSLDKGWLEYYGGYGLDSVIKSGLSVSEIMQVSYMKVHLLTFLMIVSGFIVLSLI